MPEDAEKHGPAFRGCTIRTALVYVEACTADLYYWSCQGGQKFNWLASTAFDAGGGS